MKVQIFSEDFEGGIEVDWPAVPREGEVVAFDFTGGVSVQGVESVQWVADADGNFLRVVINLTY